MPVGERAAALADHPTVQD